MEPAVQFEATVDPVVAEVVPRLDAAVLPTVVLAGAWVEMR